MTYNGRTDERVSGCNYVALAARTVVETYVPVTAHAQSRHREGLVEGFAVVLEEVDHSVVGSQRNVQHAIRVEVVQQRRGVNT